jgi:broad specificity phosphatase PhoE
MAGRKGSPPAKGSVVHLVRHAKARDREDYLGRDSARPLSGAGKRQAAAIAACFGESPTTPVDAVLSSPALRCVETVKPLASGRGLDVGTRDWLDEGTPGEKALERMVIAAAGLESLVVCSHGDVIWDLLDHLVDQAIELDSGLAAPKASIWELEIRDGKVHRARFRSPP